MNLTAIAQATLLLTCHFSAGQAHEHQPLSLAEWGRLALWLRHQRMSPADLLTPEVGIRLVALAGSENSRYADYRTVSTRS